MPQTASSRFAPDIGTVVGFIIAAVCIGGGLLLEGGKIADIRQGTAAIIVLGGTLGAVMITSPLPIFWAAMKRGASVFVVPPKLFEETLDKMAEFAERARRLGLACLEAEAAQVDDVFLRKALGLAADGTDLQTLREMMTVDADIEMDRAEEELRVWESAGGYAPTVGIIGAVLGLIQVMKHLENLDEVGRGIAVAFVATVYGVFAANVIFLPIAGKLKAHSCDRNRLREMMIDGVIAIAEGINPKLLRIKFEALVPPKVACANPVSLKPLENVVTSIRPSLPGTATAALQKSYE
jgi:chemotaxis protein MotA